MRRPTPELPEVYELEGRDAFEAMVEYFGHPDHATTPMPLDDLPAPLTLIETEFETIRRKLGHKHKEGHATTQRPVGT